MHQLLRCRTFAGMVLMNGYVWDCRIPYTGSPPACVNGCFCCLLAHQFHALLAARRCLQAKDSQWWLLLPAHAAEQLPLLYCLTVAASIFFMASIVILVSKDGAEGTDVHDVLSAWLSRTADTKWHECALWGRSTGTAAGSSCKHPTRPCLGCARAACVWWCQTASPH